IAIKGDVTIEGITFKLIGGFGIDAYPGVAAGSQVTFRRNVVTSANPYDIGQLPFSVFWNDTNDGGGTIRIVDNLIHDNNGGSGIPGAGAVWIQIADGNPKLQMINNTVVDNGAVNENGVRLNGVVIDNDVSIDAYLYNNILYGNGGANDLLFHKGNGLV